MPDVRDEIEMYQKHIEEVMPAHIRELISKANSDLYSGPTYYDAEGDECEWCDEGAIPFGFSDACARIAEWFSDNVSDVEVEIDYDADGDISYYESVSGSADAIIRNILGRELASYV